MGPTSMGLCSLMNTAGNQKSGDSMRVHSNLRRGIGLAARLTRRRSGGGAHVPWPSRVNTSPSRSPFHSPGAGAQACGSEVGHRFLTDGLPRSAHVLEGEGAIGCVDELLREGQVGMFLTWYLCPSLWCVLRIGSVMSTYRCNRATNPRTQHDSHCSAFFTEPNRGILSASPLLACVFGCDGTIAIQSSPSMASVASRLDRSAATSAC